MEKMSKRGNPDFYDKKHEEGYVRAQANIFKIMRNMDPDRYQRSEYLRNMIKALSMLPWRNDVEDWQRMEEAKIILKIRGRK